MEALPIYQVAEIELIYRPAFKASERPSVKNPKEAAEIFLHAWNPDTLQLFEEFKVMLLSRANKVLGIYTASKGGISGTIVDISLIMATALKAKASSLIICHNHPSGRPTPSTDDIKMTEKIKHAAHLMGMSLQDHIILTADTYTSFADSGNL
jgi:DNA repair protein RadC